MHSRLNQRVIRLRRKGCVKYAVFDIVVAYRWKRSQGDYIERIGFLNPHSTERCLFLDSVKLARWLSKGVILGSSVRKYIAKFLIS